ncbi:hypothetical protein [Marivirga arenosa]|uniref:Uncharacterized protein n=1 Tax=Marivirga arenosa TaxID=3059076 RepID=A0AA51X4Q5_9BACT|nr:hypothetical protein [Marivirga sp. BKB1-2]WNB16921.1 hypothetical protein QYS47_32275 [Marivirga sp. BKB1-2]
MENIANTIHENSFHLKKTSTAPEQEMKDFWKDLRHFYRTAEKNDREKESNTYHAALQNVIQKESAYPYKIIENHKEIILEEEENMPLFMLDFIMSSYQIQNRKKFKEDVKRVIEVLKTILDVDSKSSQILKLKENYGFAAEMIAFEKMVDLLPKSAKSDLSKSRIQRLKSILNDLQKFSNFIEKQHGVVVYEKALKTVIEKNLLFKGVRTIEAKTNAFELTEDLFKHEIKSFTILMKAFKMAQLEIEDEYEEEIHDDYFEHFNWHHLQEDELRLFVPVLCITDQNYLNNHLTSFGKMMMVNHPVNVVIINQELVSEPNPQLKWVDSSYKFRQEIAALAIAQRNIFTFQSTIAEPALLYEGVKKSLGSYAPSLIHISVPSNVRMTTLSRTLLANAANAGRYFPMVQYDPIKFSEWGRRFSITSNIQPTNLWPSYSISIRSEDDEVQNIEVNFTYADYKAIFPEKVKELMIIPAEFETDQLIPVSEFLEMDLKDRFEKIPFIYLADDNHELFKAAVPYVWILSCQERADYWAFLQELAGFNSYKVRLAVEEKNKELNEVLENERKKLEEDRIKITQRAEEKAVATAAQRLVNALMEGEI